MIKYQFNNRPGKKLGFKINNKVFMWSLNRVVLRN